MNLRKHKLLGILSEQYILSEIGETENKEIGLNDDVILEKLKMSKYKYELIKQSLLDSAEVERHNPRYILGLYSTLKGVASFNDKKYTKAFFDDIINILKNIVQIVIPILSLFIAYYAIQLKISENSWPVLNVADVMVHFGVLSIIISWIIIITSQTVKSINLTNNNY